MTENIAVILVHGVGTVDERAMMRVCATQFEVIRPGWQLDGKVSELHHVPPADPTEISRPPIQIRRGRAEGRTICLADAYWGDISLVRADILSTVWGILINMLGLRYFASVALESHRFLRGMFAAFVFLIAAIDIPLNLFAFLYALVVLHLPPKALVAVAGDEYSLAALALTITAAAGLLITGLIRRASLDAQRDRPLIRHALLGAMVICASYLVLGAVAFLLARQGAGASFAHALMGHITGYGDLFQNQRWMMYAQYSVDPNCAPGAACITPAGVFLSNLYLLQVYPLWIEALISIAGLIAVAILAGYRTFTGKRTADLILSVGSIHVVWFLFGSVLLFIIPADITTNFVIDKNIGTAYLQAKEGYRAYWFEVIPAGAFMFSAVVVTSGSMAVARPIAVSMAKRRWASGNIARWKPVLAPNRTWGCLVGPRLLVSNWFVGLIWLQPSVSRFWPAG